MQISKLKNGAEEMRVLVGATMLSLKSLLADDPMAFYDLVELCKDPDYTVFGDNIDVLKAVALVGNDGKIHGSIKNIIVSAVTGEGLDMVLGSPVADT